LVNTIYNVPVFVAICLPTDQKNKFKISMS
jgi:hypothetical protein